MPIEWDDAKQAGNIAKHGIDFASIEQFDWLMAVVRADVRFDYGEVRLLAIGPMTSEPDRLFAVVYTVERRAVRIISFRRASNREIKIYEAEIQA
ncbi:MAG TPA: BrnT family toxin [Acetobacteraceae bacterium]|nr:BrnT family toxin [Acetobacteraceae bacterium]